MSLAENKKARMQYELLDMFDAGVELFGHEVKSLRAGRGQIVGAFVKVRGGEAYLVGATIPEYQAHNTPAGYEPDRPRRLLLTKQEIAQIANAEEKQGLTSVPLAFYNAGQRLKLKLAIARGKHKRDKRETIKMREEKRRIERTLKR